MSGDGRPLAGEPPIRWGNDGLIPAVAQDATTGDVLMVGFVNAAALAASRATGVAHYWSRSRQTLWRKGETSGNEQEIVSIAVNCEQNSLLLTVRQRGAVCHDGYPTCFYRRLEADNGLTVVRDRTFDPASVYGPPAVPALPPGWRSDLTAATHAQWAAYAMLRDLDLQAVSATSRRLRGPVDPASARVGDELLELAGVLEGHHVHDGLKADVVLEGSQILYWTTLAALWHGHGWDDIRPDTALAPPDSSTTIPNLGERLRDLAEAWKSSAETLVPRCRETLQTVAAACGVVGIEPIALVIKDLADLRQKPYFADAFASFAPPHSGE